MADGSKSDVQTIPLDHLVLDPALQCRAVTVPEVVEEYAEALLGGATLPPIAVVCVGDQLLVVDGWHRLAAARRAKRSAIEAVVTRGERRDAMLAAIRANTNHGLRRSQVDKRRAVRALLSDAEWCQLSARQLAELGGVSHAYVAQLRKEYSVDVGVPLTAEMIELVDGDLPPAWAALARNRPWESPELRRYRAAKTAAELAQLYGPHRIGAEGLCLRLTEIGTAPWPWPDTTEEERQARVARLDDADDLADALESVGCPSPAEVAVDLWLALEIPRLDYNNARAAAARWVARPTLRAAAELRAAATRPPLSPWEQARAINSLDPEAQVSAVQGAADAVLANIRPAELAAPAREALRVRVRASPCPDPRCSGWVRPEQNCWRCYNWPGHWRSRVQRELASANLLTHAGIGVRVRVAVYDEVVPVVVDRPAIALLGLLQHHAAGEWREWLPYELLEALDAWQASDRPELLVDDQQVDEADEVDDADEADTSEEE